jgi:sporulation protein YtfJ
MPEERPIENLIKTAMESIKGMLEVNTVVGNPMHAPDGTMIIPVTRVSCGFMAGGGKFDLAGEDNVSNEKGTEVPGVSFGGGSGGGVSVKPVGFLIVSPDRIKLLQVEGNQLADKLIDLAPEILARIQGVLQPENYNEYE